MSSIAMHAPPDKPVKLLRRFAKQLGWTRLRVYQHRVVDAAKLGLQPLVTWYESGESGNPRTDCFLQINEHPVGQRFTYSAAVYAVRFRLYTGWHRFTLYDTAADFDAEAVRLNPVLGRQWFVTLPMRRAFRERHPEFTGFGWRQIQKVGAPVIV